MVFVLHCMGSIRDTAVIAYRLGGNGTVLGIGLQDVATIVSHEGGGETGHKRTRHNFT